MQGNIVVTGITNPKHPVYFGRKQTGVQHGILNSFRQELSFFVLAFLIQKGSWSRTEAPRHYDNTNNKEHYLTLQLISISEKAILMLDFSDVFLNLSEGLGSYTRHSAHSSKPVINILYVHWDVTIPSKLYGLYFINSEVRAFQETNFLIMNSDHSICQITEWKK